MEDENIDADAALIDDAVRLNQAMFALPFQLCDEVVETRYPDSRRTKLCCAATSRTSRRVWLHLGCTVPRRSGCHGTIGARNCVRRLFLRN